MNRGSSSRQARFFASGLAVIGTAALLVGCEQMPNMQVARGDIRNAIARGEMTSPRAATVALVSLEGAPDSVEARFRQSIAAETARREMVITDEASARYLVRGYLSAYPGETGTTISYVYDVFDAGSKQRRQRVNDTIEVPATGDDPWGSVNDTVMTSLASRSADELAVALAGTPEAQAGVPEAQAGTTPASQQIALATPATP